jgi:bifunctional glutamyl/prolyl-tRNA synthetase
MQHYFSAKKLRDDHMIVTEDWNEFTQKLDAKFVIQSPFCGLPECEERIKKDSTRVDNANPGEPAMGAKSLCIPLQQPKSLIANQLCIHPDCKRIAKFYTLFGRSY